MDRDLVALLGVVSFRRARTTVNPLQPATASHLVVSGIYRRTRNPMYLGRYFILLGGLMLLGWWWLLVAVVACIVLGLGLVRYALSATGRSFGVAIATLQGPGETGMVTIEGPDRVSPAML